MNNSRRFHVIYKLTFPNGKIYIGRTVKLKDRIREHRTSNGKNTYLSKAIIKYGDIFQVNVVDKLVGSYAEANDLEQKYISKFRSDETDIGYNIISKRKYIIFNKQAKHCLNVKRKESHKKIVKFVLDYQQEFFNTLQLKYLKPLNYLTVCEKTGCDIHFVSTISNSTYIDLGDNKQILLKNMFNEKITRGSSYTNIYIHSLIGKMTTNKEPYFYTDNDLLVELNKKLNINISARTINKYRRKKVKNIIEIR